MKLVHERSYTFKFNLGFYLIFKIKVFIEKIYKITFSDGSSTECTSDHLWNVCSRYNKYNEFLKTNEINKKYNQYETLTLQQIINNGIKIGKTNKDKWFIPEHGITQFNTKEIKLDPYIMGCLLGDGCLIGTPSITSADQQIIDYFKTYFYQFDMNITPSKEESINYYISTGKGKKIKFNELWPDKTYFLFDFIVMT